MCSREDGIVRATQRAEALMWNKTKLANRRTQALRG